MDSRNVIGSEKTIYSPVYMYRLTHIPTQVKLIQICVNVLIRIRIRIHVTHLWMWVELGLTEY